MKKNLKQEIDTVTKTVEQKFTTTTDRLSAPVRNSLFKRFPITMVLVVVFGITAVTYGAELMFSRVALFTEHPIVLVLSGLFALLITGKLYQKLG